MDWFKMSAAYDEDTAVVRAGEAAEILFVRGIAYATRAETGGFIPDGIPERRCPQRTKARIKALVDEGLWVRDNERRGWWIRSWARWQNEQDELSARRRADRERQQRKRQKDGSTRDMSRDDGRTERVTSRESTRDLTRYSRARDRERDREVDKERSTQGPYATQGRNARAAAEAPPSDEQPSRREQLLAEHRDSLRRGLAAKVAEQLAEQIQIVLTDPVGFTDDEIRGGLGLLDAKGLGPGFLPQMVTQYANQGAAAFDTINRRPRTSPGSPRPVVEQIADLNATARPATGLRLSDRSIANQASRARLAALDAAGYTNPLAITTGEAS
jgi:hypothetical protein